MSKANNPMTQPTKTPSDGLSRPSDTDVGKVANPGKDAIAILVLFQKNLDEIFRWYRNASERGSELGHVILGERFVGHINKALALALKGESWSAPDHNP
jgi:hypothetical protein